MIRFPILLNTREVSESHQAVAAAGDWNRVAVPRSALREGHWDAKSSVGVVVVAAVVVAIHREEDGKSGAGCQCWVAVVDLAVAVAVAVVDTLPDFGCIHRQSFLHDFD